jgi:hypothetical protein
MHSTYILLGIRPNNVGVKIAPISFHKVHKSADLETKVSGSRLFVMGNKNVFDFISLCIALAWSLWLDNRGK